MKIESLKISGFGLFEKGTVLEFKPGFNLIYGRNEAGKSTLLQFVIAMLYGMKEEGRSRRSWLKEHEIYRPWRGNEYGGELLFSLKDGSRAKVVRNLSEEKENIKLIDDITGRDVTKKYHFDKTKELTFCKEITGFGRELFLSSACVKQMDVRIQEEKARTLASFARNIIGTGSSDTTAQKAIDLLNKSLEEVGKTERGKILGDLIAKEKKLLSSIEENQKQYDEIILGRTEYTSLSNEIRVAREDVDKYNYLILRNRIEERTGQLHRLKELNDEIQRHERIVKRIVKDGTDFKSLDPELKDNVIELETEIKEKSARKTELINEQEELEKKSSQVREELKSLKHFSRISQEELDKFREKYSRRDEWKNELEDKRAEFKKLMEKEKDLSASSNDLISRFIDLPEHADQIILQNQSTLLELKNDRVMIDLKQQKRSKALFKSFAIFLLLIILGILFQLLFKLFPINVPNYIFIFLVVLSGGTSAFIFSILLKRIGRTLGILEKQASDSQTKIIETGDGIEELLKKSKCDSVKEFINLYNEYKAVRNNSIFIEKSALQKEINQIESKIKAHEHDLINLIERAYPGVRADKLNQELVNKFLSEGKKFIDLNVFVEEDKKIRHKIDGELKEIKKGIESKEKELLGILKQSGVKDVVQFKIKIKKYNEWAEANKKLESCFREAETILQNRKAAELEEELQNWCEKFEKLKSSIDDEEFREADTASTNLQKEKQKLEEEISEKEKLANKKLGAIEEQEDDLSDRSSLESELENVRRELNSYRFYKESLEIAINVLEEVSVNIHRKIAPKLGKEAGTIFSKITEGKYSEIKIEEDLAVNLIDPNHAVPVKAEELSAGTCDQIYLSLRFALVNLLTADSEPIPIILDDAFAQFDDNRTSAAMVTLEKLSGDHQVLMFSCHRRDLENYKSIFNSNDKAALLEL